MARLRLSLSVETDLVHDCINDLGRVYEALRGRHGRVFRDLERHIEAIEHEAADKEAFGFPVIETGRMVMTPPASWVAMVAEAKAMGVI